MQKHSNYAGSLFGVINNFLMCNMEHTKTKNNLIYHQRDELKDWIA